MSDYKRNVLRQCVWDPEFYCDLEYKLTKYEGGFDLSNQFKKTG